MNRDEIARANTVRVAGALLRRLQHLEDTLAAMNPSRGRTPKEVAELRARLQRLQQTVGLDDEEPHAPSPVQPIVDLHDPTDA